MKQQTARNTIFALAALALVGCGKAGAAEPATNAILDGVADLESDAVMLTGHMIGAGEMCTGVLVTRDVVLTARHCITTDEQVGPIVCDGDSPTIRTQVIQAREALVLFADTWDDPAYRYVTVAEVISVPNADSVSTCGNDLIALRLAAPETAVAPVTLRLEPALVVGDELSIVGFGANPPDDIESTGYRRRRDGVLVESVGLIREGELARVTAEEFVIDEGACPGDSGGPAFDENGALVGIMSRGNRETCQGMIYEQLASHASWLRELARASSERTGDPLPEWAEEPTPDAGVATADAGVDASTEAPTDDGGGCTVMHGAGRGGGFAWVALGIALALRRRRR